MTIARPQFRTVAPAMTILVAGLLAVGCSKKVSIPGMDKEKAPGMKVWVAQPTNGTFDEVIYVTGKIAPKKRVGISARVSARIAEMPLGEGATVAGPKGDTPGSLLVRLDSKDLEEALNSATAEVKAQEVRIEVARINIEQQKKSIQCSKITYEQNRRDLARTQALFRSGDKSRKQLEDLQLQFDRMTNEIESAELTLKTQKMNFDIMQHTLSKVKAARATAQENLGYTVIHSPIDGVITQHKAQVGEIAMQGTMNNAGTMLLEVADLTDVWFKAEIPERQIGKMEAGMTATIQLHAYPEKEFLGEIESVGLKQTAQGNYEAKISLQNKGFLLRAGLKGEAAVAVRTHEGVLKLPNQAVLSRRVDELPTKVRENSSAVARKKAQTAVVYRVIDDKAVVTPVRIGPADAHYSVLLEGVATTDRVIAGPYRVLEKLAHDTAVEIDDNWDEKTGKTADQAQPDADAEESVSDPK